MSKTEWGMVILMTITLMTQFILLYKQIKYRRNDYMPTIILLNAIHILGRLLTRGMK